MCNALQIWEDFVSIQGEVKDFFCLPELQLSLVAVLPSVHFTKKG
jgi:hypothetical protein